MYSGQFLVCGNTPFRCRLAHTLTLGSCSWSHTLGKVTLLSVSQKDYWSFHQQLLNPFVHLISQLILISHQPLLEAWWCKDPGIQPWILNLCSLIVLLLFLPARSLAEEGRANIVSILYLQHLPVLLTELKVKMCWPLNSIQDLLVVFVCFLNETFKYW